MIVILDAPIIALDQRNHNRNRRTVNKRIRMQVIEILPRMTFFLRGILRNIRRTANQLRQVFNQQELLRFGTCRFCLPSSGTRELHKTVLINIHLAEMHILHTRPLQHIPIVRDCSIPQLLDMLIRTELVPTNCNRVRVHVLLLPADLLHHPLPAAQCRHLNGDAAVVCLRRLHRTHDALLRQVRGHDLRVDLLRVVLHVLRELRLQRLSLGVCFLICFERREPIQRHILRPCRLDRSGGEMHGIVFELRTLSFALGVEPLPDFGACLLLQVFHNPCPQDVLRLLLRLLQPAFIRLCLRLSEERFYPLLAAEPFHRTIERIEGCRLDLVLRRDHERHHRLYLGRWMPADTPHEMVDFPQILLELSKHPAQGVRGGFPLREKELEPTGEPLLPPTLPRRLLGDHIPRSDSFADRLLMGAELLRPRRILILLRRAFVPFCPGIHRLKVFGRGFVQLSQRVEIHQEHVPHLMQKRRFIRPRKKSNDAPPRRIAGDLPVGPMRPRLRMMRGKRGRQGLAVLVQRRCRHILDRIKELC